MKDKSVAYLLWIAGFFGIAGLHRFYVGKPLSGLLWLLTGGLFGIGTLIDAVLIPGLVDRSNQRLLGGPVHLHLHGDTMDGVLAPSQRALPAPKVEPPEKQILRIAARRGGVVTPQMLALESDLSIKDAQRELMALVEAGHCTVDVAEDGAEVYRVAGLGDTKPVF